MTSIVIEKLMGVVQFQKKVWSYSPFCYGYDLGHSLLLVFFGLHRQRFCSVGPSGGATIEQAADFFKKLTTTGFPSDLSTTFFSVLGGFINSLGLGLLRMLGSPP